MFKALRFLFVGRMRIVGFGGLVILIAILAALLINKPDRFRPVPPDSLLKRIEYVQHLRLTTYYYEEIIALGTRKRVKMIVDQQREKVEYAQQFLLIQTSELIRVENHLDSLNKLMFSLDTALLDEQQKFEQARMYFEQMDRFIFEFPHLKKRLEVESDYFGLEVEKAFLQLDELKTRFEAKPWKEIRKKRIRVQRKKMMADSLKVYELDLKQALDREKELRRNLMARHIEKVKQLQGKAKEETHLLKDLRKAAEKNHKRALNAFEKASKELQGKRDKLAEAEIELKKVLETGQDSIKPELLVIVPAELSSYIDLREMKVSKDILSDTVSVLLPPVHLDSVIIELDSTKNVFDLGGRKVTLKESAMYYEIYQQLKDAVIETEKRVKVKAKESGIYQETESLARQYITDFANTLGYEVRFVDSEFALFINLPGPPAIFPDSLPSLDSLPNLFIDSLPQLPDSLLPELPDSLIVNR